MISFSTEWIQLELAASLAGWPCSYASLSIQFTKQWRNVLFLVQRMYIWNVDKAFEPLCKLDGTPARTFPNMKIGYRGTSERINNALTWTHSVWFPSNANSPTGNKIDTSKVCTRGAPRCRSRRCRARRSRDKSTHPGLSHFRLHHKQIRQALVAPYQKPKANLTFTVRGFNDFIALVCVPNFHFRS